MTAYDRVIDELAERVNSLPRRCVSALFLACATALRPMLTRWAERAQVSISELFDSAAAAALEYAVTGQPIPGGAELLNRIEAATPPGEASDTTPSTTAQDCWICLDTSVRTAVDSSFRPGPVIEYALEPKMQAVSERRFGVTQVGSGPAEDAAISAIVGDPDFIGAVTFVEWATMQLASGTPLDAELIEAMTTRAAALRP